MWRSGQKGCSPRDWLITPRAAPPPWAGEAGRGRGRARVPAHACRRGPLSGRVRFRSGPIGARRGARAGKAVGCPRSVRTRALSRSVRGRQRAGRARPPLPSPRHGADQGGLRRGLPESGRRPGSPESAGLQQRQRGPFAACQER
ncbi:PCNA-associated factor isoform X2 [Dermochelys coriacea]|uniref:PCNA-associated factor isoform X2 n=1 Tax=Dermochelys coriacea TaxID=27794 RepID=UPI001CAA1210|nr:PCNA-associated factor isoform X2 [Dermochelys coriacea]